MIQEKKYLNPVLNSFIEKVGATLAGVKPAELMNISMRGERKDQWEEGKKILEEYNCFKVIEVQEKKHKRQVFFLHLEALNNTLSQKSVQLLLKDLNYPREYSLKNYVHFLVKKIKGSSFPHEIGVFLGYPVKDVLGFIGCPTLKLTEIKGWRYYGHRGLSVRTYERFKEAREKAKRILEKKEVPGEILKFWEEHSKPSSYGCCFEQCGKKLEMLDGKNDNIYQGNSFSLENYYNILSFDGEGKPYGK
ncbi:DUF3793 family protein [Candidatus Contubernalis alkaliaceticus]|uniref:DUF3793 family protein n=1 Tax=Candidatus Contubernalis alkaliaceticus TaxID=338645 RepID=UPI001F4C0FE8|nr:DUF3793 family protein [Candidatus Contubernalis alkalaceticus]UNC92975.1 DUF3793 family protein [Candidatus Contubernalis alkalaceticus]